MFGDTWAFASSIVVLAQVQSTSSHRIIRDFSARLRGFLMIIMQQPRPGDGCDLGENLATEAMTNLAQRGLLGVREHQSAFQLVFQDAVFGSQIFVPGQQLLVHRLCEVGQDARPIHNGLFAPIPCGGDRPKKCTETPPAPLCWPPTTDRPISRFIF